VSEGESRKEEEMEGGSGTGREPEVQEERGA